MNLYLYRVLDGEDREKTHRELKRKGLQNTYIIQEDATGAYFIGGQSLTEIQTEGALLVEAKQATVDWEEQWSLFAADFQDGKAHIHLDGKTLTLLPGPGFGDLSHPTTALMIEMMKERVKEEAIVDIGTGSGILALAALLLGAKSAIGIDIDPEALKHARKNARLNHLSARFSRTLPRTLPKESLFLMNLILPEQRSFQPERLNSHAKNWIVSGILSLQKSDYLLQTEKWGWEPVAELQRMDWCGWVFKRKCDLVVRASEILAITSPTIKSSEKGSGAK